jgi:hypothetical protein
MTFAFLLILPYQIAFRCLGLFFFLRFSLFAEDEGDQDA